MARSEVDFPVLEQSHDSEILALSVQLPEVCEHGIEVATLLLVVFLEFDQLVCLIHVQLLQELGFIIIGV